MNRRVGKSDLSGWLPEQLNPAIPPYLALVEALEADIRSGHLAEGTRLPTHRDLANALGLSISTVSKAYREAAAKGIIHGHVGKGTYVRDKDARVPQSVIAKPRLVNIGINKPPSAGQAEAVRSVLKRIASAADLGELLSFSSHQGIERHLYAVRGWMQMLKMDCTPDQIFITNGAQHALEIAVQLLNPDGGPVLVEELTYVGFRALSAFRKFQLVPVAIDGEGMIPEALDKAVRQSGGGMVYSMPTLHSPTARTMSAARRRAIAQVLETHRLSLIEDDVYGFLCPDPPLPLSMLLPDRSIYISSFSKIFDLGFRLGAMVVPASMTEQAALALRASAWTSPPFMAEIVAQMLDSGTLGSLLQSLREEVRRRYQVFREVLGDWLDPEPASEVPFGYHVWVPLPSGWSPPDFFFSARYNGIIATPPGSAAVMPAQERGVRLCLGACNSLEELRSTLVRLRALLERPPQPSLSTT